MDKNDIEFLLKENGIARESKSYQDYKRAKEIIIMGPMSPEEYSFKIKVIIDYLNI